MVEFPERMEVPPETAGFAGPANPMAENGLSKSARLDPHIRDSDPVLGSLTRVRVLVDTARGAPLGPEWKVGPGDSPAARWETRDRPAQGRMARPARSPEADPDRTTG